jgi:MFS family permease
VVWAISIVMLEVPSGALADTIGRRNLLVVTGVLMVAEMLLLCFVPKTDPAILFPVFLLNRLFSGTAEAAASGADEALAYDALKQQGRTAEWGRVLEKQMRMQAVGYIMAMSIGAAVYDPGLMQKVVRWLGLPFIIDQNISLRFPLYLTLCSAVLTLVTALKMKDIPTHIAAADCKPDDRCSSLQTSLAAFKLTLQAGRWILRTPFALVIILTGLVFDNTVRMFMTLLSQYFRLIELPEAAFGLIGSGLALMGVIIPRLARTMVERHSPLYNFAVMTGLTLMGLIGITLFIPIYGLIPVFFLSSSMYLLNFCQSHYLNRITASEQRATVLSFKGLSNNLAYGIIGILYSLLLAGLRSHKAGADPGLTADALENSVFVASIGWFPWYFLTILAVLILVSAYQLRGTDVHRKPG